jgi:hypothetical protein
MAKGNRVNIPELQYTNKRIYFLSCEAFDSEEVLIEVLRSFLLSLIAKCASRPRVIHATGNSGNFLISEAVIPAKKARLVLV